MMCDSVLHRFCMMSDFVWYVALFGEIFCTVCDAVSCVILYGVRFCIVCDFYSVIMYDVWLDSVWFLTV